MYHHISVIIITIISIIITIIVIDNIITIIVISSNVEFDIVNEIIQPVWRHMGFAYRAVA